MSAIAYQNAFDRILARSLLDAIENEQFGGLHFVGRTLRREPNAHVVARLRHLLSRIDGIVMPITQPEQTKADKALGGIMRDIKHSGFKNVGDNADFCISTYLVGTLENGVLSVIFDNEDGTYTAATCEWSDHDGWQIEEGETSEDWTVL